MKWFSMSWLRPRRFSYPPPVDKAGLRTEVDDLNIAAEAAALALAEQPPLDETRPTAIESSIKSLFDEAQARAEQITFERIDEMSRQADLLNVEGDEADFDLHLESLGGKLNELAAEAGLTMPPLAQEKVKAALEQRAFLRLNNILGQPTFDPLKIRWITIGLLVTLLEALFTAWIYAPTLGDRESWIVALLIGASVTVAGLVIACGILLAKHRRKRGAMTVGSLIVIVGTLIFLFVALCAAHFRLMTGDADSAAVADVAFSAVQTALAVAESLWSRPTLPFTDPPNLGFMLLAGATMSGFVYETNRTWGYWGYRPVALRAYKADRRFKREARNVVSDMQEAGSQSKLQIGRQVDELRDKDRASRRLRNSLMVILAAHSTATKTIAGERQRALAVLLDAYRAVVAKGRPIAPGFAQTRSEGVQSDIVLPADFDQKIVELQGRIYSIMGQRAQAQALADAKVSGAITTFTQFLANLLATAEGTPSLPSSDTPS